MDLDRLPDFRVSKIERMNDRTSVHIISSTQRPMALQHGRWILLSSSLSLLVSLRYPRIAVSPWFWLGGAVSFLVVYAFENWLGFAGAIGVAIFLPPLASPLVRLALQGHALKTMWFVWLVADVLAFLQVLTAAYAFVPGAKIMRERTGL